MLPLCAISGLLDVIWKNGWARSALLAIEKLAAHSDWQIKLNNKH